MFQTVIAAIAGDITIGNTVNVQSSGLVLSQQAIPAPIGNHFLADVTNIPSWVRVVYALIAATPGVPGENFQLTLTGASSGVIYADNLEIGSDFAPLVAIPYAAILDPTMQVAITNLSGAAGFSIDLIAMPDAGIIPVQALRSEAIHVSGIVEAPDEWVSATATLAVNTPRSVVAAPPTGSVIRLWHVSLNNAAGGTAVCQVLSGGGRLWVSNIPNAGDVEIPFFGLPLPGPGGDVSVESDTAGNLRYTVLYTIAPDPFA